MPSSNIINERQLRILESLARYTYLTTDQFVRLGIANHTRNVRDRYLRPLIQRRKPLVGYADFHDGLKRLPRIQFLTSHGLDVLMESQDGSAPKPYFPKGKVQFTRDYRHRVETVDCAITLDQWAEKTGQEIDLMEFYFQHESVGKGLAGVSRVEVRLDGQALIPDMVFRIKMTDGESRLYVLELNRQPKPQRLVEEIRLHTRAIDEGLFDAKYAHPYSHRVLSIYKHPVTMQSVMRELSSDRVFSREYLEHFLFADQKHLLHDLPKSWSYCDGTKSSHFQT